MIALALLVLAQDPAPRVPTPYWQQDVAYDITARLDEPSGVLSGRQRVEYRNNSPDTLTTFAFHLHLNAFRPGSRWADADSAEGRRRFNDLRDPDFAFNHVRNVRIMGRAVEPVYPFAPDSTIVRFALPEPLPPDGTMTVELDWDARPSTVPRRQGRQGRRFDFAQWYPRVVVYDRYGWQEHPLYPAGEFYGEFGQYRVALDVPEDQVVGATGVPLCGDPGWERANRQQGLAVEYRRDAYPDALAQTDSTDCAPSAPGRKTIVWYAEDVHHFAMSLNPDYRYEGGRYGDVAIHVLYQPGDEVTWGTGNAVRATETAMAWLDRFFGPYGWPQITNVHRIEGGGTEFPMMMHNGSASLGLIIHEAGHNYVHGLLGNNEWREGWLDEGFTSFQTTLFWEQYGRPGGYEATEARILGLDLEDYSEPVSLVSEDYRDFTTYNMMIYARGELFFHQLRHIVGDSVMRRIVRTYYDRWKFKHVDEEAFQAVAEEVSGQDLSTFFGQWLHSTVLYDYAVGKVETRRTDGPTGAYETRVEVVRRAPGRIPVDVAVITDGDTTLVRVNGLAEREWVTVPTAGQPDAVVIDPFVRAHDWNMLNNRWEPFNVARTLFPVPGTDFYFHPYFSTRSRRDRMTVGLHPTVWYNDAGGVTLGVRSRDDYLGRFEQHQTWVSYSTGWGVDGEEVHDIDFLLRLRNPVWLRMPNVSQTLDVFHIEGRYGAAASFDWERRPHLSFGPTYRAGARLQWVRANDLRYLDPGYYQNAGTVEAQVEGGINNNGERWQLDGRAMLAGGVVYGRRDVPQIGTGDELYMRAILEGTARRSLGAGFGLGLRAFAGVAEMEGEVVRQRRIFLGGADPYQQLFNPFLRSRGALLAGADFNYHVPGGAGLRGFDPRVDATYAVGLTAELERSIFTRSNGGLFRRIGLAAFGDAALADAAAQVGGSADGASLFADAGIGLRAEHRIGQTSFVTRLDLPLYVTDPALAQDRSVGDGEVELRWVFSFEPAF